MPHSPTTLNVHQRQSITKEGVFLMGKIYDILFRNLKNQTRRYQKTCLYSAIKRKMYLQSNGSCEKNVCI